MRHIMFDIETLGVESSAVVLSAAFIEFGLDENPTYKDLLSRAQFVKFDVKEQITKYHRTVDQDTLDWWKKRPQIIKDVSLTVTPQDLILTEGIEKIRVLTGCNPQMKKNFGFTFWQRGGFDQIVFESLCRSADIPVFTHFSCWRDVRTAVELLNTGAVHGYVEVPSCPQDTVHKHDPRADCAYDIMQLLLVNSLVKEEVNE